MPKESKKSGLLLPDSVIEDGEDAPNLFYPRVWVVKSIRKETVQMDTRAMRVDAKLASGNLYRDIQAGQVKHFDEALAEARVLKDLVVHFVELIDETSGKEIQFEITGGTDKSVHEFVDGVNAFEAILVQNAINMSKTK